MSSSFPKVRGFKKDKRNLLESSANLVVFGQGQPVEDSSTITGPVVKGRRLLRRGSLRQRRNRSKSRSLFPPGVCSTTQKLDRLVQKVDLTNYFSNTKPWQNVESSTTKKSTLLGDSFPEGNPTHSEILGGIVMRAKPSSHVRSKASSIRGSQAMALPMPELPPIPEFPLSLVSSNSINQCPSLTFVNDVVCPVCLKSFEPFSNAKVAACDVMKQSYAAHQHTNGINVIKNLEEGWMASARKCVVDPADVVVAANCGELFHRLCLRDWCSRGHRKSPRSSKPVANCPSCGKELKYTLCQEIEMFRCFTREPTMLQKEFNKVKHVNKELQILWPETNNYLAKIKKEIEETDCLYEELRGKRRIIKQELKKLTADDLGIVMANVTDVNTLKSSLAKQEKALEFMQQETLQIMRMYLLTIIRKLKEADIMVPSCGDFSSLEEYKPLVGRVPVQLVPYLQDIVNDNHALSTMSRILAPYRDNGVDESQQKYLELELIQKFAIPKSPPNLTRPNTYVVSSSAPEVGESDSDDVIAKKLNEESSSDDEPEEKQIPVTAVSSVKASTATHDIPTIPSDSKQKNMLRPPTLSQLSVPGKEKPPQLLKVLEIDTSLSTIDSRVLEERLKGVRGAPSPNGGGSVDKTYDGDINSPTISCPPSINHLQNEESSELQFSKNSMDSSMFGDVGLHLYEPESKYVRVIRKLIQSQGSVKSTKVPPVTAATGNTTDTIPEDVVQEIIKIHTGTIADAGSDQLSSTNSETKQLNEMLIAFMRQQQLEGKLQENEENSGEDSDNVDRESEVDKTEELPQVISEGKQSTNTKSSKSCNENEPVANKSIDGSSVDTFIREDNLTETNPSNSIGSEVVDPTAFETQMSYPPSSASVPIKIKSKPEVGNNDSCDSVFKSDFNKKSSSVVVGDSENGDMTPPKLDEVSIAIMYIIEDDEDGDNGETVSSPGQKQKSPTRLGIAPAESEGELLDLPPLPLPSKALSPVFLTAEKSSNFSIICDKSGSAFQPENGRLPEARSSKDFFADLVWPRPSRMISVDTPSDPKLNDGSNMELQPTFYTSSKPQALQQQPQGNFRLQRVSRRSVTSLLLPPLPEEMASYAQRNKGAAESVVPTLFYENETSTLINNANKKLAVI